MAEHAQAAEAEPAQQAEAATSPPRSRMEVLRQAISGATVIAAVLYAYGWILVTRFYDRFGVSPEEAGFGFGELTVRVGVVLGIVLAIVGVPIWLVVAGIGRWQRHAHTSRTPASRLRGTRLPTSALPPASPAMMVRLFAAPRSIVFAVVLATYAVFGASGWLAWDATDSWPWWWRLPAVVYGGALAGGLAGLAMFGLYIAVEVTLRWIRTSAERTQQIARWVGGAVAVGVVGVFVLALGLLPAWQADRVIDHGQEVRLGLPGLVVLRVERVEFRPIEPNATDESRLPPGACVHYLGSSGSVSVVYDHERKATVRVPTGSMRLVTPCAADS